MKSFSKHVGEGLQIDNLEVNARKKVFMKIPRGVNISVSATKHWFDFVFVHFKYL